MKISRLLHRIKRTKMLIEKYKESHGDNSGYDCTYYGGWNLGYHEGKLAVLEELLDTEEYEKGYIYEQRSTQH